MSWWGWVLVGLGAAAALAIGYVVFLAAMFTNGDNPSSRWPW